MLRQGWTHVCTPSQDALCWECRTLFSRRWRPGRGRVRGCLTCTHVIDVTVILIPGVSPRSNEPFLCDAPDSFPLSTSPPILIRLVFAQNYRLHNCIDPIFILTRDCLIMNYPYLSLVLFVFKAILLNTRTATFFLWLFGWRIKKHKLQNGHATRRNSTPFGSMLHETCCTLWGWSGKWVMASTRLPCLVKAAHWCCLRSIQRIHCCLLGRGRARYKRPDQTVQLDVTNVVVTAMTWGITSDCFMRCLWKLSKPLSIEHRCAHTKGQYEDWITKNSRCLSSLPIYVRTASFNQVMSFLRDVAYKFWYLIHLKGSYLICNLSSKNLSFFCYDGPKSTYLNSLLTWTFF